jgi:hypothetical protein
VWGCERSTSATGGVAAVAAATAANGPSASRYAGRLTVPSATISAVERNGLLNVDTKTHEQLGLQRLCAARRLSSASLQLCSTSLSFAVIS